MTFIISSGPAFLLTFLGIVAYAFYIKAPFNEFWIGLVTLYGLHAGKRLWQKLKTPQTELANGGMNGEVATK